MENLPVDFGGMGQGKRSSVDEAQEIMYDAWDAPTRKRAVALARKALSISPDCTDAWQKKIFKEDGGYFWGLIETRPYM